MNNASLGIVKTIVICLIFFGVLNFFSAFSFTEPVFIIINVLFAIIYFILGIGLHKLKDWAITGTIVFGICNTFYNIFRIFYDSIGISFMLLIIIVINIAISIYLIKKKEILLNKKVDLSKVKLPLIVKIILIILIIYFVINLIFVMIFW